MDLLYVLGNGSKHDDVELRFSLRSIEKWCKGYDRIFVVGRKPDWLTNVEFYPCEDDMGAAHKNMMKKILLACNETDISNWFVSQSDDHFYVRPYDFKKTGVYHKGEIHTMMANQNQSEEYVRSMLDTCEYLKERGYGTLNGSQHCGCLFYKPLILQLQEELFKPGFDLQYGIEPSSTMANALVKHMKKKYVYRRDCKVSEFHGEQHLKEIIGDNFCFSIYDRAFQYLILPILKRWYPEPSKYELY